jgi:molybdopterin/thiamine biosynthesis adenylyltransferase
MAMRVPTTKLEENNAREGTSRTSAAPAPSSEASEAGTSGSSGPTTSPSGRIPIAPWWQTLPERLDVELQALRDVGITFVIREEEKAAGRIVLDLKIPMDGEVVELVARYPDVFPYTRPEVDAPGLTLKHHQNPVLKNLCLLDRRSDSWTPQMTLAELLREQLPKVLSAGRAATTDETADLEVHQAEPISAYLPVVAGSICLIDGSWRVPDGISRGRAKIIIELETEALRATVTKLQDAAGRNIAEMSWPPAHKEGRPVDARWISLDSPIVAATAVEFERELRRRISTLGKPQYNNGLDLILIGFPEETSWRSDGVGWVLLVRQRVRSPGRFVNDDISLVRVGRVGPSDLAARIPEFATLRNSRVGLIGAGCVGGPIAFDLARGGLQQLLVVDDDFVDPAAGVRWVLGQSVAGRDKVNAVAAFIAANYPLTKVRGIKHRVGSVARGNSDNQDRRVLGEIMDSADIVVDASAEFGIQRLLSDIARQFRKPYIAAYSTHGAYGGVLMRLHPDCTGCWYCVALHTADGTIPQPPALATEWVQPHGCEAPTFVGASWDLGEVSLAATRLIVATLMGDDEDYDWDVAILSLRDGQGRRIAPQWQTFSAPIHPQCPMCNAR